LDSIREREESDGEMAGKTCSARWRACATRHRPESAEEKQLRSRGVCGRSRQSHDERERYNLRQRYAEGVCLTSMPISVACYSRVTDQDAVGNDHNGRPHSDCSGGDLHRHWWASLAV